VGFDSSWQFRWDSEADYVYVELVIRKQGATQQPATIWPWWAKL